jgi:hypothetical protein
LFRFIFNLYLKLYNEDLDVKLVLYNFYAYILNKNMDKTREEKRSALKLINKYAESYNNLEAENKQLKTEINDLKLNLKINKQIIESFYSGQNSTEVNKLFQTKLKEQNDQYLQQIDKLIKENEGLRYRNALMDQMIDESINSIRSENEKLKSKIFVMDNCLTKKDNIIQQMKRKVDLMTCQATLEVYITEPTEVSLKLQYELGTYKDIYNRLLNNLKEHKKLLTKYEKMIQDLQAENIKLTHEMKYYLDQKYEKEREDQDNSFSATAIRLCNNKSNSIGGVSQNKTIDSSIKTVYIRKYYELEEWWSDALRSSNMDEKEFKCFRNNKAFGKIVDLIEFLNNIIIDKNFQIKIIEKENTMLNEKLDAVNKENFNLYQQLKDFAYTKETTGADGSSMHNNHSNNLPGITSLGLGLIKGYQVTVESVNSNDFMGDSGVVQLNYFTNESKFEQHMSNISIS